MSLLLHSTEPSPPCRAVLMVLDILGLEANIHEMDPIVERDQYKPEFLAKNPLHSIPLLEDRDFILADSHAIITYLVSKYGAEYRATLYTSDIRVRATIDQRLFFDATMLFTRFRAVMEDVIRNSAKEVSAEQKMKFDESYAILEKYLETAPYLAGDHVTLADISCVASVSALDIMVPIGDKYVKLLDWYNRMKQNDWYQRANEKGLSILEGFLKKALSGQLGQ